MIYDLVGELAIFRSRKKSFNTDYGCTLGVVLAGLGCRRTGVHKCNYNLTSSIDTSKACTRAML